MNTRTVALLLLIAGSTTFSGCTVLAAADAVAATAIGVGTIAIKGTTAIVAAAIPDGDDDDDDDKKEKN